MDPTDTSILSSSVTLPCGVIVQNRLAKVAMYEHLGPLGGGPPNDNHIALYSTWARGNWGIIITGNVQVSASHLSLGADLVVPSMKKPYDIGPWRKLAAAMHAASPGDKPSVALMQLNHTGRQSPRFVGGRSPWNAPFAPSSKRVGSNVNESWISNLLYQIIFHTPKEMTSEDIDRTLAEFCFGAKIAKEAGFDGIQLHGSHGYLITQFMSPKTNLRKDEYAKPLLFLQKLAKKIRSFLPAPFVLALKLNAADYVEGGMTEEQSLQHLTEIAKWQLFDIIEISGGDYENPGEFLPPVDVPKTTILTASASQS
ncbi:hypothetical protein M408DRAFT_24357 [Serendipita vermifera MAFF 305830]|uniref:NADH:flavin oxidoreductase/NADH oxidase N-terminal domain-containing protein n=1 Tax=Serendipita vermifera MAFF 305830 TaxID=933852 RepID=A0A0C3B6E8_SERVB|nr:hypothetical protein M408DRAFT_24357 [Serendipita vermifera MAFF 305830]